MNTFMKEGNVAAVIIAVLMAFGIWQWQTSKTHTEFIDKQIATVNEMIKREETPARNWFLVRNVNVPDFIEGEDPLIVYDREISKHFFATWNVEIREINSNGEINICEGSGSSSYEPSDKLPHPGVRLSWYIGKDCHLKPGTYVMQTTWEMRPPGYPTKETSFTSNQFEVLPVGSQRYITPEQVEKIEGQ